MAFNHYARIKRILAQQESGWYIKKISEPTSAKNFKGETIRFPYYYRMYAKDGKPIKYCKFQQIELLAKTLRIDVPMLPILED